MPELEVVYGGVLRAMLPSPVERMELAAGATVADVLAEVVRRHGPATRDHLLDADGRLLPDAVVIVDGAAVPMASPIVGSAVRILVMSPMMSGG